MIHYDYAFLIKLLKSEIKTHKYAHKTFEEKFWEQVNKNNENNCWTFIGKLYSNGYGCFKMNNIDILAHRISFLLHNKFLPDRKHVVMHICDNKKCVNPDHLIEGTYSDNIIDMITKGRDNYSKGDNHFRSKIKESDVKDIIQKRNNGIPVKQICLQYNISTVQVYRITTGTRRQYLTKGLL